MKIQVVLPKVRETKGTVVYAVPNIKAVAIGQVYVNKDQLKEMSSGGWPDEITVSIEAGDTTEVETA